MSKIYYFHTTKLEVTKQGIAPACTISLKMSDDKNYFQYGVAICSKYDNFSKKYGREVADNRLNQGFGIIKVPKIIINDEDFTEHEACIGQLYNLVLSVVKKTKKWKKKITRFNLEQILNKNKEQNQGAKPTELKNLSEYNIYGNTTTQP